jgi:antitoxin (DNA-binding transcriptional repressor) of toxin-antitoxin stability system
MIRVTTTEAQKRLPDLLVEVQAGGGVEIHGENGHTFRLVANPPRPPVTGVPRAGSCKGLIDIAEDFDAPLEELREYWE